MARATIKDVAREAGVSLSTVNKALTGKTGISKELKEKILATAERLDYKANRVAGSLARSAIKIGTILPSDWEDYYNDICDGIAYEMERLSDWKVEGMTLKYSVKGESEEQQALECFEQMYAQDIHAVIFCHGNYSAYKKAMDFAESKGIKVVCVGIGLLDEHEYFSTIEVDAYKCGRIAAELLENMLPEGSNAEIIIGSENIWPHKEKVRGFVDRLSEKSGIHCHGMMQTLDNDSIAYELTKELLKNKTIGGIYIATGAAEGVCRAAAECGRKIKIISTDISGQCRRYIENGTIAATIYQNTFKQGVTAVDVLYKFFSYGTEPKKSIAVAPVIYTKESLMS